MLRGDVERSVKRFLQTLPSAPPRRRRATDETPPALIERDVAVVAADLSSVGRRGTRFIRDDGLRGEGTPIRGLRESSSKRFTAALRRRAMTQHTARARGYIPRPAASETRTADRAESAMPTTAKDCGTPSARARHTQRRRRRAREIRPAIWSTSCARRCLTTESIRWHAEV